eukprot:TRINITY_DN10868_c0_g1_i10.p1 TRINITY_DN10868_c0_g1~~TRINITY_DN10868_c0_g1_i10.p1  ORF type:complete len:150 (+),score=44.15 TRINITY_DN10868_c0_g1_i10:52-501(+)
MKACANSFVNLYLKLTNQVRHRTRYKEAVVSTQSTGRDPMGNYECLQSTLAKAVPLAEIKETLESLEGAKDLDSLLSKTHLATQVEDPTRLNVEADKLAKTLADLQKMEESLDALTAKREDPEIAALLVGIRQIVEDHKSILKGNEELK